MSSKTARTSDEPAAAAAAAHLEKHVHLTNCIHLKNRFHLQRHKMMVENINSGAADLPFIKELTALSRTRSLRDPSTTSTLKSPLMKTTPSARKVVRGERSVEWNARMRENADFKEVAVHREFLVQKKGEDATSRERRKNNAANDNGNDQLWKSIEAERFQKRHRRHSHEKKEHQQQQQRLSPKQYRHGQGKATHRSPSPLSMGIYDDQQSLSRALLMLGMNRPPQSSEQQLCRIDQRAAAAAAAAATVTAAFEEGEEYEEEEEEAEANAVRSRPHSPLLSRDASNKSEGEMIVKHKELSSTSRPFNFPSGEDDVDNSLPRHGCGIPWHWSRIHNNKQKGKSFLDMAGRSLSCGYSDPSSKRKPTSTDCHQNQQPISTSRSASASGRELITTTFPSDLSYSSAANSDAEVLPLLTEAEASEVDSDGDGVGVGVCDRNRNRNRNRTRCRRTLGASSNNNVEGGMGWLSLSEERRVDNTQLGHRSLSHKFRPRCFKDIVGQKAVVQALCSAALKGKVCSAYLFHGARGTGKTSLGRVFGAALNCLSSEEVRPCGLCRECVALNLGKSMDVREFDLSGGETSGVENVKQLLHHVFTPPASARFRVSIVDDCHMLSVEAWDLLLKHVEQSTGHSILILTTTTNELPRAVASRCQTFHFTKIKDSDIATRLEKIATKENIHVDSQALQLIAARSNGSLFDAEIYLDQLSLLGQAVTLTTVQQLIGLVPNDKLLDLLDSALCGDTMSTVKCVREILECGVEPLRLMSQLATMITDVLAGSFNLIELEQQQQQQPKQQQQQQQQQQQRQQQQQQRKRGFFRKKALSKQDLERIRQALKMLCEAEKQVRASSDQTTWLTAAMLQFAPHRHHHRSKQRDASSTGTSATQSLAASDKESVEEEEEEEDDDDDDDDDVKNEYHGKEHLRLDDVWRKALSTSRSKSLNHLLHAHGKLVSLSFEDGYFCVDIEFQAQEHKATAEKLKTRISHAFEIALGRPVRIQISKPSNVNVEMLETAWAEGEGEGRGEGKGDGEGDGDGENEGGECAEGVEGYSQDLHYDHMINTKLKVKHLGPHQQHQHQHQHQHHQHQHQHQHQNEHVKVERRRVLCWQRRGHTSIANDKEHKQRRWRRRRACLFLTLVPCTRACS